MARSLEQRVSDIETRNRRVEADKAWEGSGTRKVLLAVLTYVVIVSYLLFIRAADPFVNAVVPAVGFYLSTLVVGRAKRWWIAGRYRRPDR